MTPWPDLVNGAFELAGTVPMISNVRRLWRDREARGVAPWAFGFFATWGAWNLYFYPHLAQWASLVGTFGLCGGNLAWIASWTWFRWTAARRAPTSKVSETATEVGLVRPAELPRDPETA